MGQLIAQKNNKKKQKRKSKKSRSKAKKHKPITLDKICNRNKKKMNYLIRLNKFSRHISKNIHSITLQAITIYGF